MELSKELWSIFAEIESQGSRIEVMAQELASEAYCIKEEIERLGEKLEALEKGE
jgi:hypothetical protein